MAESLAGVGVWQYDYATGSQEWSEGLKGLFGIDRDSCFGEGDAESLLYASKIDLVAHVVRHRDIIGTFSFEFAINSFDGTRRKLTFKACNLRGRDGSVARVVAVMRDTTDHRWQEPLEHVALAPTNSARSLAEAAQLLDRREAMRQLDMLVMKAREYDEPLVLAMIEVDRFSRIASSHGGETGEAVIDLISRVIQQHLRASDVAGRMGDHGFLWIMRGTTHGQARVMIERLRHTIKSKSASDSVPEVTVSLGIASMQQGDSALSMFGRADFALGEAKQLGFNRVRVAA